MIRYSAARCSSALALVGAAAATLVAVAPAWAQADRQGGTLVVGSVGDPKCWDHQNGQGSNLVIIQRNVFDSLVFQNLEGGFEPWLAKSWEISDDGKAYTFHLRDDVRFSNGEAFDAEAVRISFDRLTSEATASRSYAGNFPYAGAEVLDEFKVRINLESPLAAFLQVVSSPGAAILAPSTAALDVATLCKGGPAAVGTGPFVYAEYAPDQSIRLVRNPDYAWAPPSFENQGAAWLDELRFVFLPETSVRVGALTSGQVDFALGIAPADYISLEQTGGYTLHKKFNSGSSDLLLLNTSRGVFAEAKVRQALQRGVDYGALVQAVYRGTHGEAFSILTPDTRYYDTELEGSWDADEALAGQLLDEAGWTGRDSDGIRTRDGARLSAVWVLNGDATTDLQAILAEGVQAEARRLGIELRLDVVDAGSFGARGRDNDYDLVQQGTNRAEADILRSNLFGSHALPENRLHNFSRVQDPGLDRILNEAAFNADDDLRRERYAEVQRYVQDNAFAVPLVVRAWLGASRPGVQGIKQDVAGFPESYHDAWLAK